ncbi:hypothetical protein, partial [Burkholderia sp. ABCPW 111]|uniref:hypothetical protein n=1 Tax=Burkholderia sp. ABCPW 111 TaxID=1820025 RepID=UPI001F21434F
MSYVLPRSLPFIEQEFHGGDSPCGFELGRFILVHRRKPWRVFERLHNLTPDFKDVGGSNCSIE